MRFNNYAEMFSLATGESPFPYQELFATTNELSELVHAPTGSGKTATVVFGWLWRRRFADEGIRAATPRRLVYCLPMRVLVEQTCDVARRWIEKLGFKDEINVHVLMGGADSEEWDLEPEAEAILVGTQDMLLSRAMNRGYGMSRYRWPMHYALLNNDCLWVFDEIQLMDAGLACSTQLEAFRRMSTLRPLLPVHSVWMSATLRPDWLASVDFRVHLPHPERILRPNDTDFAVGKLNDRHHARKKLRRLDAKVTEAASVAHSIRKLHEPGSLTLLVVNTVDRARDLYRAMTKAPSKRKRPNAAAELAAAIPKPLLIHSRFRPEDRKNRIEELKKYAKEGGVVISTQVIEAGIDISARVLVTELAPWPSLVQRFGRCNRYGEHREANVFWVDVPTRGKKTLEAPYSAEELDQARVSLSGLDDVSPACVDQLLEGLTEEQQHALFPYEPAHVLRRKDFVELFDTTPDLAGNDIDVSRFIRSGEDLDVQVFWRDHRPPTEELSAKEARRLAPQRLELCPVPFQKFRDFLKNKREAFRWDALDGQWSRAFADQVFPGQMFWLTAAEGGYDPETGWDANVKKRVPPLEQQPTTGDGDPIPGDDYKNDGDPYSQLAWQSIAQHTDDVVTEAENLADRLGLALERKVPLLVAARWHDWGKAHEQFQLKIAKRPPEWTGRVDVAKAPDGCWFHGRQLNARPHFRHELASALGVLALERDQILPAPWEQLDAAARDLALYLIAAHHGKVRLSIRSLPDERPPTPPAGNGQARRFARGIWDEDGLPGVDLGAGIVSPDVRLSLAPMDLGLDDHGRPSWVARVLQLRDDDSFGPIGLAFLESMLRIADMRASRNADQKAKGGCACRN